MGKLVRNSLLVFASLLLFSCFKGTQNLSDKDCQNNLYRANFYLNDYYADGDEESLRLSLSMVDSVFNFCPENKAQSVGLKITLLMLLRDYDQGVEFVNTLDEKGFDKPYKRSMYLSTFKALSCEVKGDSVQRDVYLKKFMDEIENHISRNPMDKSAIADLFFTKIKFYPKEVVMEEIDQLQKNSEIDKEFYEALKESVKFTPKM